MKHLFSQMANTLEARKTASSEESYVASLYEKGLDKILEKVGEEAVEMIIAAKNSAGKAQQQEKVIYETADLWFHSLVMLSALDIHPEQVLKELARREGVSGLEEKAQRSNS